MTKEKQKNIDKYWHHFLIQNNIDMDLKYSDVFYFGDTKELAAELIDLVLKGNKRATTSAKLSFEKSGENYPAIGNYLILTDYDDNPKCIAVTTNIKHLKFSEMTFELVRKEGEDEVIESWRDNHIKYYKRESKILGYEYNDDLDIIFEEFEVVYPK